MAPDKGVGNTNLTGSQMNKDIWCVAIDTGHSSLDVKIFYELDRAVRAKEEAEKTYRHVQFAHYRKVDRVG